MTTGKGKWKQKSQERKRKEKGRKLEIVNEGGRGRRGLDMEVMKRGKTHELGAVRAKTPTFLHTLITFSDVIRTGRSAG